jgi:hypothetical protein
VDFSVDFLSSRGRPRLQQVRLLPQDGRCWSVWEIPLAELKGQQGSMVFCAAVNASANADGDWVAIGRGRISETHGSGEKLIYDLLVHVREARIEPEPAIQYHTPGNIPVFPMPVWLEQEPTKMLLNRRAYRPTSLVRVLEADTHAGFWSMGWGMLPYSLGNSDRPLESISVYSITRQVDGYEETNPRWAPTWHID